MRTIEQKIYDHTDPRLGRHVRHDSKSLRFLTPALPMASLVSTRHGSLIPTLDQGQIGSCTGNAGTKVLGSLPFWSTRAIEQVLSMTDADADEKYALGLYSAATVIDSARGSYPPTDTGSDGLSIAKVLKSRGLISGYTHVTSLEAALSALQDTAIITGTEWRGDMYNPASNGRLKITGSVEGGHEFVLDEIDVENKRVWMQNSWGDGWGVKDGRAWFTWDDYEELLHADGDATVFVPKDKPAPIPDPDPDPDPDPEPDPDLDPLHQFVQDAVAWVSHKHTSKVNVTFVRQVESFLDWFEEQ